MIYRLENPILGRVEIKNDHGMTVAIVTIGRTGGGPILTAITQGLIAEGHTVYAADGEELHLITQEAAQ